MLVGFCVLVLRSESLLVNTAPLTRLFGHALFVFVFEATLEVFTR